MGIILYDAVPSANSERVRIVLEEKHLPYERVTLNLDNGDHKRGEFLKMNPYGKVPVINDGGKIIFESCIINEYLDDKYSYPALMPRDPYLRARGRILIDYALIHIHEPYWTLRAEMRKQEVDRDRIVLVQGRHKLTSLLQYLESALEDQEYFLGKFSLTDIDVWPRLSRLEAYGALQLPTLPRLAGWLTRMKMRPSVQIFADSLRVAEEL
jgi:glutathione S-transferase